MQKELPLATMLARQPGTKEARYAHLLSGEPIAPTVAAPAGHSAGSRDDDRLSRLEEEVAQLRQELSEVKQQLTEMKKVFD
jgi:hypothetical protein